MIPLSKGLVCLQNFKLPFPLAQEKHTQYFLSGFSKVPKLWEKYGEKSSGGSKIALIMPNNVDPSLNCNIPVDGFNSTISLIWSNTLTLYWPTGYLLTEKIE